MTNTTAKAEKLLFWIETVPDRIMRLLEEELSHKASPGKWSKKEILGHLADSALHSWQRFALAKGASEELLITPYPQDQLVEANAYQFRPIGEIIDLWRSLNRRIYHLIANFSEKELRLALKTSQEGVNDLAALAISYVDHLEHHLSQIFSLEEEQLVLPPWQLGILASQKLLQVAPDPFIELMSHGSMMVELYKPEGKDLQQPHRQDELYIILSGIGIFRRAEQLSPFGPGDVLFVPAGVVHRFESFTDDFQTWVVFYGAQGGERF